ncbi:MAG: efflux RND transporter periplasmic adaptor subunit [Elusimicrobia bacterium]|jgi:Cu(I)/Ag(I) efflux system membrane fusion protein|nr:efflux RND transporter periplasmic adaptor subunit [Elusimicrobiota bacterium]
MKRTLWIFMAIALVTTGSLAVIGCKGGDHAGHAGAAQKAKYHCPMHPTYVSDRQGDCPICGMRLVPIESQAEHEEAVEQTQQQGEERKPLYYRHPMQPNVTSPEPKKDEMGMDYVPVYPEEAKTEQPPDSFDRAAVSISSEKQQLIGVRTAPVARRTLGKLVRASGRVAYDPDLYNAIVEYLEALKSREKLKDSPWPDVRERSDALIKSSTLRLRQMGLSRTQIDAMTSESVDPTNLLLSETGGSVWVYAQIYEYEAGTVKAGQTMEVTSLAFPGRNLKGRVVAVDTVLDPETRTLRARGEIQNPEGLLKPEMFVDTVIHVDLGRKLALPEEALIDTGTRQFVFVQKSPGKFEPRPVKVGRKTEEYYEILSGLKEGEEVVTSGNFLIDSESRLKAALSQTGAGGAHQH